MSRRCPPGVFCIENVTIFMVAIIVLGVVLYLQMKQVSLVREKVVINEQNGFDMGNIISRPNYYLSNSTDDVLLNPYQPPLRDDRSLPRIGGDIRGVPINIRTQGVDSDYRQVGILTRNNNGETILPLMGRPLLTNRDKWQFYTMNDKNNMIKLPVTFKGKSCTNEYGCENIYNGDTVYVEGFNDTFKATIYDTDVMRYIPYL